MPAPLALMAVGALKNTSQKSGGPEKIILIVLVALIFTFIVPILLVSSMFMAGGGGAAAASCGNVDGVTGSGMSGEAIADIPPVAVAAYQKAGTAAGIDWTYIAAIGKVESNHGRYGGAAPDANGLVTPKIIGIPLNGSNGTAVIRDTDGGLHDGDTTYDRAVGPMQFIPSTWATSGQDGNFDGFKDPHSLFDAALATGRYLVRGGAPGDMNAAIYSYNHAQWYVDKVVAQAALYRGPTPLPVEATIVPAAPAAPAAGNGWVRPTNGPVTSRFGPRKAPKAGASTNHKGTDFGSPAGTPVLAANSGTISFKTGGGAGNALTINHGTLNGVSVSSHYFHLLPDGLVKTGTVTAGQPIGLVGSTGNSTGPHLHLEIHVNGIPVNPETFLASAGSPIPTGNLEECVPLEDDEVLVDGVIPVAPPPGDSVNHVNGDEAPNIGWGGHQNGQIPTTAMCGSASSQHYLRCDAMAAWGLIQTEWAAFHIAPLTLTRGYESLAVQTTRYATDPNTSPPPGSSPYGWGTAISVSVAPGAPGFEDLEALAEHHGYLWDGQKFVFN